MSEMPILVQRGDEVIELTGKEKDEFLEDIAIIQQAFEADVIAKQEAKESANSKLLALGLNEAEIEALKG
jgi:hypothetical protein